MTISVLEIAKFRNIIHASINASPYINVFFGQNGSGKTSILEAVYLLGLGRSFRTKHIKRTINTNSDHLSIFANIQPFANSSGIPVGMERYQNGSSVLRVAEQNASSLLAVADILPFQLINSDSHRLLTGGPSNRRQYLDWGVYHIEPSFYPVWQRLQRALKQRNCAIKARQSTQQIQLWDQELDLTSNQLDLFRQHYIEQLKPIFSRIIETFLPNFAISLNYYRGWDETKELHLLLSQGFTRDIQLGYTIYGAHKADLLAKIDNLPAQEILSQGQQKLVAYALRLSQGIVLENHTDKKCLYLIDDLPAELDQGKRALVAEILLGMKCQVFVTGIDSEGLRDLALHGNGKMFHVEHGKVLEIQSRKSIDNHMNNINFS